MGQPKDQEREWAEPITFSITFQYASTPSSTTTASLPSSSLGMPFSAVGEIPKIGHPGIGKTRGGLAYTLQELLSRGEAVMRVGYKTNQAHLFLPRRDRSSYSVWQGAAARWSESLIVGQLDLFVLIDPPEEGPYSDGASCRVIKYASNNRKHYHNLHKDGVMLLTAMPTEEELVAMTLELWNDASPFPWQRLDSLHEREAEVRKRARIIGRAPRYVFSALAFQKELYAMVQQASALTRELDGRPGVLLAYLLGEYTSAERHESSVSSRLFVLEPEDPSLIASWAARDRAHVKLKDVAALLMGEQLERAINAYSGQESFLFERFVQDLLESGVHSSPPLPRTRAYPQPSSQSETCQLMVKLMQGDESSPTYFCTSRNFPVIDFVASGSPLLLEDEGATMRQEWWNAKVGQGQPEVKSTAFVTLMRGLGMIDEQGNVTAGWKQSKVKLRFICSANTPVRKGARFVDTHASVKKVVVPHFERAKELFEQCVTVECVSSTQWIEAWRVWKLTNIRQLEEELAEYVKGGPPTM